MTSNPRNLLPLATPPTLDSALSLTPALLVGVAPLVVGVVRFNLKPNMVACTLDAVIADLPRSLRFPVQDREILINYVLQKVKAEIHDL